MKKFKPHTTMYCIAGRMFTGPTAEYREGEYRCSSVMTYLKISDFIVVTDGSTFKTTKNRHEGKQITTFSFEHMREYIETYYKNDYPHFRLNPHFTDISEEKEMVDANNGMKTPGYRIMLQYLANSMRLRLHEEMEKTNIANSKEYFVGVLRHTSPVHFRK
ncbi:MAG: hypothetical protein ACRCWQ_10855 [Bacilli bacterium]